MGAGLVVDMVLGMAHAGGSHEPAHHHDDEQQSPD